MSSNPTPLATAAGRLERQRRSLAARMVLGAFAVTAVFYAFDRGTFPDNVWKPLGLYIALAVPAYFLLDVLRKKLDAANAAREAAKPPPS
ncbi:MAG TPA: hypothetical protein VGO62_11050 [Myxococcota bacterium]